MVGSATFRQALLIFGIPVLIISMMIVLATSNISLSNPSLFTGIAADLMFTVPFIYFLLIRKKKIPKFTVASFFVLGVVLASFIIPEENQFLVIFVKNWILPIIEVSVFALVFIKIRKAIKVFRSTTSTSVDFFTILKTTCSKILPERISIFLAMEIAVFYYGFIYWKKRALRPHEYTYHKNSGTIGLLAGLMMIIAIETYVLHVLAAKWSITAAWVISIISIYSLIQVFGFLKSFFKRPVSIENEKLHLRYGILSETIINLKDIKSVEITSSPIIGNDEIRKLSPLGELENHNIVITLKKDKKEVLYGLYGLRKTYHAIAFHIDLKNEFKAMLDKQISLYNIK